jgi:predicted phosphodiesterase
MKKIIWLSDLHLDVVSKEKRDKFYKRLSKAPGDAVVITGDISKGRQLCTHLLELGEACGSRPIYFVLGNHDYYGSSFSRVHGEVESLCKKHKTLRHLGNGEIIPLGDNEALVGHGGWSDGRAGNGTNSRVRNPDFWSIDDFRGKEWRSCYGLMDSLGKESSTYFREVLPYALTSYRHVWIATHFPPFTQAVQFNGKPCNYDFQPHYTNMTLGYALWGMSTAFPGSSLSVLCGHTHSEISLPLRQNLHIHTAGATPGYPRYHVQSVSRNESTEG